MSSHKLDLDLVHSVDAVDEQYQDEDKGDFHPVLQFGHEGALGDEAVGIQGQQMD
jgi:hypothetical protein